MSTSTDAQLSFGVLLNDDNDDYGEYDDYDEDNNPSSNLPWCKSGAWWDDDVDHWWYMVNHPETEHDKQPESWTAVWDWVRENPPPITLVNYCSDRSPEYILAVPSSVVTVSRGYPEVVDFDELHRKVLVEQIETFTEFLYKYKISYTGPVAWRLGVLDRYEYSRGE